MLNSISLQGRLTRDPEIKQTATGKTVCETRIAVERDYAAEDGKRKADFFDMQAWGGSAELLHKWWHKGDAIVVNGSIHIDEWTDNGGAHRIRPVVIANDFYFSEKKT